MAEDRLRTAEFDFDLPRSVIADRAAVPRDAARLMVVADAFRDLWVGNLPVLLGPGEVLVVNDTRVIRARRLRAGSRFYSYGDCCLLNRVDRL